MYVPHMYSPILLMWCARHGASVSASSASNYYAGVVRVAVLCFQERRDRTTNTLVIIITAV